jgi:hypothetical protein
MSIFNLYNITSKFSTCAMFVMLVASCMSENVISGKIKTLDRRKFLELVEIKKFSPINYYIMDVKFL